MLIRGSNGLRHRTRSNSSISTSGASIERNYDTQPESTEPHGPAGDAETSQTDATTSETIVGTKLVSSVSAIQFPE